jgi:hypothetical protein
MENITKRCRELKTIYPEKTSLFENYVQNQAAEYDALENKVSGSIMVLKLRINQDVSYEKYENEL